MVSKDLEPRIFIPWLLIHPALAGSRTSSSQSASARVRPRQRAHLRNRFACLRDCMRVCARPCTRVCLGDCAGARENLRNVKPRVYMSLCPRGSHWLAFSGAQALWGKIFYRAPPRGRMLFLSLNALERCIWTRLRLESESVLILIPKTDTKNCLGGSDAECGFSMPSCIHVLTDAACKRPCTHIRK